MARQELSVEERRRRNREYQKKLREKIHSEAEINEEYLIKGKKCLTQCSRLLFFGPKS